MRHNNIIPYIIALGSIGIMQAHAESATYLFPDIEEGSIKIDTLNEEKTGMFSTVTVNGYTHQCQDGEPMLPVKIQTIKVPAEAMDFSVSLNNFKKMKSLRLPYPLVPVSLIHTKSNSVDYNPNIMYEKIYTDASSGPQVKIEKEFFINGSEHYLILGIYPLVYDARDCSLDVYGELEIAISYNLNGQTHNPSWPLISRCVPKQYDLSGCVKLELCANGKIVPILSRNRAKAMTVHDPSLESPIANYVILVPGNLKDACADLVTWKRMKGYNVLLKTFEEIYASPDYAVGANARCFDKASSVREWMKQYYLDYGLFYCFIIGDYQTSAPTRKFRDTDHINFTPNYSQSSDKSLIPSDVYFADLYTPWNHSLGACGEYEINANSVNFSPTIPVGRLICSEQKEIKNYIRKLLLYEIHPGRGDMDYLSSGVRVQHPANLFWNGSKDRSDRSIFKHLSNIESYNINGTANSNFNDLRPEPSEVIEKMKCAGLYSFQVHGGAVGFRISQECDANNSDTGRGKQVLALTEYKDTGKEYYRYGGNVGFDNLKNSDKPSVLYSLACDVAFWDPVTLTVKGIIGNMDRQKYNMASAFTVAGDFGGVAFLGNSREGRFTCSAVLEECFSRSLLNSQGIGIAENESKLLYMEGGKDFQNHIMLKHNLIGDPDFKLWQQKPNLLKESESLTPAGLIVSIPGLLNGEAGIHCNGNDRASYYLTKDGKVTIPTSSFVDKNGNFIGSVYLKQDGCLPYLQLIANGTRLNNCHDSFIFRSLSLGTSEDGSYRPVVNLGSNSEIRIKTLSDINSNAGITVGSDSRLSLESDTEISLTGDKVEAGGKLILKAKEVEFGTGFEIAKGGELEINNL